MRRALIVLVAIAVVGAGCGKRTPPVSNEVVAVKVAALPASGDDPLWREAPVCTVPLIPQDMVEPRLLRPSTPAVRVQAATDGARLAFHITWVDSTKDDLPGAARFCDACAVQLPAQASADLPAPQMGEAGRPVEMSYWSSAWQARADGRKADIHELYPNATVDHYPFEAASLPPGSAEQTEMSTRFAPARAVGNFMAGDVEHAVQDLIAEGPGTIVPAQKRSSDGRGRYVGTTWDVVITRPLPVERAPSGRTEVAFAVWQGNLQEVGARKMRSVWTPMSLEAAK